VYICERTILPYADARTLLSYDDGRHRLRVQINELSKCI